MQDYILSVSKNHENVNGWVFDICPKEQFFKNAFFYLKKEKKPYPYTPIFEGNQTECSIVAELTKQHRLDDLPIER